jgi:hypothetical protein
MIGYNLSLWLSLAYICSLGIFQIRRPDLKIFALNLSVSSIRRAAISQDDPAAGSFYLSKFIYCSHSLRCIPHLYRCRWAMEGYSFPRGIPRVGGRKKISGGLRVRFRGWFSGRPSASALDEKIAIHVVSQFLTQNIDRIQSELAEELRRNIDQEFGKNRHNWQRVRLVEAMQRVMLGISR